MFFVNTTESNYLLMTMIDFLYNQRGGVKSTLSKMLGEPPEKISWLYKLYV